MKKMIGCLMLLALLTGCGHATKPATPKTDRAQSSAAASRKQAAKKAASATSASRVAASRAAASSKAASSKAAASQATASSRAAVASRARAASQAASRKAVASSQAAASRQAAASTARRAQASSATSSRTTAPAARTTTPTLVQRVAASPTAQHASQIVAVVASGSYARVTLLNKTASGWQQVLTSSGRVGTNGVGNAYEGSRRTPIGAYPLTLAFGRGGNPGAGLPYRQITAHSYYISNTADPQYNTWQERASSSAKDEHLADYAQYQYAIVIGYNRGVGGGSAFFLHCNGAGATAGCVSVPASVMLSLMQRIHSGAYIINATSEAQLARF
ncbi:hypothetical protein [Lacticaseibacillus absianus]|uniref:hypothetical protein n=1 Tax=Lacticaseibacillus absianus TaxID=2729623 RepID=UPI0015C8011C|nr:hypothetical protein [Lacticaseibacillus absianus]